MIWTNGNIPMSNILIYLKCSRDTILKIILFCLPPVAYGGEDEPAEHHDKHHHSHKDHPMETAFLWRRFPMHNNFPVSISVDFLAGLNVSPGAGRRSLRVHIVVIFIIIYLRLHCPSR